MTQDLYSELVHYCLVCGNLATIQTVNGRYYCPFDYERYVKQISVFYGPA